MSMAAGSKTREASSAEIDATDAPTISICESRPGKAVLLEEQNTDGWIASDTTCEIER